MSSVNKVIILGRLGGDPEVRHFQNGGRVANFRVATSERFKDRDGEQKERTEWHTIAVFADALVDVVEKYLRKGDNVYLEGQLETRKWQDRDGNDRYSTEVVLRQFSGKIVLLGGGKDRDDRGGERREERQSGGSRGGGQRDMGWDKPRQENRGGGGTSGRTPNRDLDDEIPFRACIE